VKPDQATLVPDPQEALTPNAGWDFVREELLLHRVLERLRGLTRISLFAAAIGNSNGITQF
jgi:pyridoxine 5-phosphate synthase